MSTSQANIPFEDSYLPTQRPAKVKKVPFVVKHDWYAELVIDMGYFMPVFLVDIDGNLISPEFDHLDNFLDWLNKPINWEIRLKVMHTEGTYRNFLQQDYHGNTCYHPDDLEEAVLVRRGLEGYTVDHAGNEVKYRPGIDGPLELVVIDEYHEPQPAGTFTGLMDLCGATGRFNHVRKK